MFLQCLNFHQQFSPDTLTLRSHCSRCGYWTWNSIPNLLPEISERPVMAQVGREVPAQIPEQMLCLLCKTDVFSAHLGSRRVIFKESSSGALMSPFCCEWCQAPVSQSRHQKFVVRINIRNLLKPISYIPWNCNPPLTSLKIPVYQTLASHSGDSQLISTMAAKKMATLPGKISLAGSASTTA